MHSSLLPPLSPLSALASATSKAYLTLGITFFHIYIGLFTRFCPFFFPISPAFSHFSFSLLNRLGAFQLLALLEESSAVKVNI